MILFIIGHSCAGKTTYGKKLAEHYKLHFIDLDEHISKWEKKSITEIFDFGTERDFRNLETKYLNELITVHNNLNIVISVGGGTPCFNYNMDLMNENGLTIYLNTDFEEIIKRAIDNKYSRPLLRNKTEAEIRTYYNEIKVVREVFYNKSKLICN